jgi:hypothetical protein
MSILSILKLNINIKKWDGKLPTTVVTDNPAAMLNIPSK